MVKVKSHDIVVKKWQERASIATDDYVYGIETAEDWATACEKAFDRYQQAIQEAIREKRYVGGVRATGTAKWKERAKKLGSERFASGIRASVDEYAKKIGEVLKVIEGVTLPERGPKGDPKNYERVKAIGDSLHKWAVAKKKA